MIEAFEASGDDDAVVVLDQPPTAEVMGLVLERRLEDALPDTVSDVVVEVGETGELAAGELNDVVDPDALDQLFADKETEGHIQFEFCRYLVTVESYGSVTVEPAVDTDQ